MKLWDLSDQECQKWAIMPLTIPLNFEVLSLISCIIFSFFYYCIGRSLVMIVVFWVLMPHDLVCTYQHFIETCCLYL